MMPERIRDERELEDVLTRPRTVLVDFVRTLEPPLVIVGAGGKMGPSLAVLARRAAEESGRSFDVIAASRFGDARERQRLEACGVKTVSVDLLRPGDVARLPDATNVVYMVGLKFGTSSRPDATWATNTVAPAHLCERYRGARIAAFSTGNVYPLAAVSGGGAVETDPIAPSGDYAGAAVGRERVLEYFSREHGTPIVILRLNYAVEPRYGVLHDIALKVWNGETVDLTMGFLNCIWQGDANEAAIRALAHAASPPLALNLTGPDVLGVRDLAVRLGRLLGRTPSFSGVESPTALLSNASKACELLGEPATPIDRVLEWTAEWVSSGGRSLGKPTHFEVRDGKY